jgi:hypothetical protein
MSECPFREEPFKMKDGLLRRLLRAAVLSLRAEDAELATRFASAPAPLDYSDDSHGLAYGVFETALVYEIFKAWLPLASTEWESNYDEGARKVDLAVWPEPAKDDLVWLFEAKWWGGMSQKHLGFLDADCAKMLNRKTAAARFLTTFWYNDDRNWEEDLGAVRAFCARRQDGYTAKAVYAASFPTHWVKARDPSGAYFAMGVFAITASDAR